MHSQATLFIICGLPGAGKTTLAKHIESSLSAVRMSADDWMTALSINLHAEEQRAQIEALQWELARRLFVSWAECCHRVGRMGKVEDVISNTSPRFRRTGRALLSLGIVAGALRKNSTTQPGRSSDRMGKITRVGRHLPSANPGGNEALRHSFLESVSLGQSRLQHGSPCHRDDPNVPDLFCASGRPGPS